MAVEKLSKIPVSEIMDTNYHMVRPDSTLSEAIGIMMKHKEFELPVVADNGILKGLLSYSSLARAGRVTMNEKVEGLQLNIPKLTPLDSLERAAELMLSSDHRVLPVTKSRKIVGVVRRWKIIELAADFETWKKMKASEIMHKPVETVNSKDHLTKARSKLRDLDIRTIPVVDEKGIIVGVIGTQDIISFLRPRRRKQLGDFSGEKIHFDPEVGDIMIENPAFVSEDTNMLAVIDMMFDRSISTVIVVKDLKPVGVVSRFDLLEHIVSVGRKQNEVFVNISGLEHEDPDVMDALFGILDNAMNKINKIFTPQVLNIHVHKYNDDGNEAKYSVHMRLSTSKYLFMTKAVDWDAFRAFSEATDNLYAQVVKKKDQVKDHKTNSHRTKSGNNRKQ